MASDALDYIDTDCLIALKGLQLIQLNVRSILPKIEELRNNFITASMDVVCFTETWLHEKINNNDIGIAGFDILRNDRINKRGGGTCIFINHRLLYEPCLPNVCHNEVEMQSITLLGNNTRSTQSFKPIVVVVIYRPPHSNYAESYNRIKGYIDSIPELNKKELII